jgi:hypothetical protein
MNLSRWSGPWVVAGVLLTQQRSADAANPPSDPAALACIQASEQGQSQRDEGKYRAARETFLRCARDVCPQVVLKSCAGWLRELDEIAPTVVLGARDEDGNDVADVTVTFDGAPIASRLDGRPIELDAGEHVLRFERGGSTPVEQRLILRAGQRARVITVTMPSATARAPSSAPEPPAEVPVVVPAATWPRHVTAAALLAGAAGAAGVGLYFTLRAHQDDQDASGMRAGLPTNACTGVSTASCQALGDTVHEQHTDANLGTALLVGAGVLAVGSVATWLLWPRSSATPAQTSGWLTPIPGGALVSISGLY